MNIFYLDNDPKLAAQYHCDKHVVKMLVEYHQLLSTLYRMIKGYPVWKVVGKTQKMVSYTCTDTVKEIQIYKYCFPNHPCAIWLRESYQNYQYLIELTRHLNDEYKFRYNKDNDHMSFAKVYPFVLDLQQQDFQQQDLTNVALAMPQHCQSDNPVESYRTYYNKEKFKFARWTKRDVPSWFKPD